MGLEPKLPVLLEQNPRDGMREIITGDHEYMKRTTQGLQMKTMIADIRNSIDR